MATPAQVRVSACKAVCAIAAAHPGMVPDNSAAAVAGAPRGSPVPASLEDVAGRMRDLKPAVRRAAAAGLLALLRSRVNKGGRRARAQVPGVGLALASRVLCRQFRHAAVRGGLSRLGTPRSDLPRLLHPPTAGLDAAEGLLWIPGRAMLCACSDAQLRQELETGLWRDGLLGASGGAGLAARAWALAWQAAQPAESNALLALLAAKASLQVGLCLRGSHAWLAADPCPPLRAWAVQPGKQLTPARPAPPNSLSSTRWRSSSCAACSAAPRATSAPRCTRGWTPPRARWRATCPTRRARSSSWRR